MPEALAPETLGAGVHRPEDYIEYSLENARSVRMYKDEDISLVLWNLEPGQATRSHAHPESAHTFLVLCGRGEYERGEARPVPIGEGECVIIPRGVIHTIQNTGSAPLSYLAFTSQGPNGYSRA